VPALCLFHIREQLNGATKRPTSLVAIVGRIPKDNDDDDDDSNNNDDGVGDGRQLDRCFKVLFSSNVLAGDKVTKGVA